jgi:hypothetical protein
MAMEPSRKLGTGKPHPKPYCLQFGQTINEIEVMVGKNLACLVPLLYVVGSQIGHLAATQQSLNRIKKKVHFTRAC